MSYAAWAGVIGFVLSSANGGFTLYDQIYRQPQERKAAAQEKRVGDFDADIQSIEDMNQRVQTFANTTNDQGAVLEMANGNTTRKQPIVENALMLVPYVKEHATAAQYLVLANELMGADPAKGLNLARLALGASTNDFQRAESLRYLAVFEAYAGTGEAMAQARSDYQRALSLSVGPLFLQERPTIIGTWLVSEDRIGNCSVLDGLIRRFRAETDRPDLPQQYRAAMTESLAKSLRQVGRCSWDNTLLEVH